MTDDRRHDGAHFQGWLVLRSRTISSLTPDKSAGTEASSTRMRAMSERNWLTISDSAAWLIGGMASVIIATTMLYAGWLGSTVSELKTDVAKVNAKMDYLGQSTDSRVTVGQAMLEDKIADLKVEIDKLHHNDEIIGEKLLSFERSKRKY